MKQYIELLRDVAVNGTLKSNRTGIDTVSVFGRQLRFDLKRDFPLLTTKRVSFHNIAHELFWFLKGDTNIKYLQDNGVDIWNEWADKDGNLGPVYGKQWRDFSGVDQIKWVEERLRTQPDCRRMIVSAWNVPELPAMKLAPCHCLFQFYTRPHPNGKLLLSCQLYQRSCDLFLGVPYNIASYSLLTVMMAASVGMIPDEFIWTGGDVHLYVNHLEQVRTQWQRQPKSLPTLYVNPRASILDYEMSDLQLLGYDPHPSLKAEIAV